MGIKIKEKSGTGLFSLHRGLTGMAEPLAPKEVVSIEEPTIPNIRALLSGDIDYNARFLIFLPRQ